MSGAGLGGSGTALAESASPLSTYSFIFYDQSHRSLLARSTRARQSQLTTTPGLVSSWYANYPT